MTDHLTDYFDAPDAPEVDLHFRITIMERVALRRFVLRLGVYAVAIAVGSVCLALAWPAISAGLQSLSDTLTMTAAILCLVAAGTFATRWLRAHPVLKR